LIAQRRRHTAKSYISAKGSQGDRWVQAQPAVSFSLTFFSQGGTDNYTYQKWNMIKIDAVASKIVSFSLTFFFSQRKR
jgi:hypothetical protein